MKKMTAPPLFQGRGTSSWTPIDVTKTTSQSSPKQLKRPADSQSTRLEAGAYCRAVRPQTPYIKMIKEEWIGFQLPTYPSPPFDSSLAQGYEDMKIEIRDRHRIKTRNQPQPCHGMGVSTSGVCREPSAPTAPILVRTPTGKFLGNTAVKFTEGQTNADRCTSGPSKRHRNDVLSLLDDTIDMLIRIDRLWTPNHGWVPTDMADTVAVIAHRFSAKSKARSGATGAVN